MKRLLLTGASGFLGWNVCQLPYTGWQIEGTVNQNPIPIPGVNIHQLDLTDDKATRELFKQVAPDGVLHLAARSNANYCQQHPQETYKINVEATALLAELAAEQNIPFVFTSTDLVFDGRKGNYTEEDTPNPIMTYGEQKVLAEDKVRAIYPQAAICRMPLMFGDPGPAAGNFLTGFLNNIREGKAVKLFTDEYRTAVGGQSAAKGLLMALEHFQGTYHMGGRDKLSRYQFGQLMQQIFDIDASLILPSLQAEVQMAAPRPPDVSLNSQKAFAAGYQPMGNEGELMGLSSQE